MSNQPYTKLLRMLPLLGIVLAASLLSGCDMALLNPKGQVGIDEKNLILTATGLMLIVVIPVIFMTIYFAWKYRASNTKAKYTPDWSHSNKIEVVVWTIPCIIIIALAIVTWKSSHALNPQKPIESSAKPLVIEVVALDWKWLFIYPEQGIATVNQIAFPVNVPVEFRITSGTVMNSFFIPQLGSQIYAMGGMQSKLHLIANEAGTFPGLSANYSGAGFSDMTFKAIANSPAEFDAWVKQVKQAPQALNTDTYKTLEKPTIKHPVEYYSTVTPDLFDTIIVNAQKGANPPAAVSHEEHAAMSSEDMHNMPMTTTQH
ncbi:ubiquinol oxidase subunit II [Aquirhabdus parva]|uniref:Ubiquinol oxidase subunit 2 n=1 Tax=Aquirhabdus parva TaxID=2283318 RepID=A0A345P4Z2_9GAMM|nr:ubiquinol oxidase subunit II [Aquirhabdus parva]AXI02351.1 ubiquinol oxidase subunit II [Aquirhabdus parva]